MSYLNTDDQNTLLSQNLDSATELARLLDIMSRLRAVDGCPWDREQTPESLKPYILEEAYELLEAIDKQNTHDICDELGDLLLQVVFLAQIYNERRLFDFTDVANAINTKMIRRHPHVFADADKEQHAQRWEEIKRMENELRNADSSLEKRISKNLPALKRASKFSKKTSSVPLREQFSSLNLLVGELSTKTLNHQDNDSKLKELLADLLYQIVQLIVTLGHDAEDLLRLKTTQLIREFDAKE